jgi:hypothetical protein
VTGPHVAEGPSHPSAECDPVETVQVRDYMARAFAEYNPGMEPYDAKGDDLRRKLWSVVARELGPNAADVLTAKLQQAVVNHVLKGGTHG